MARKGENIYKRKDGRWEARYQKGRRPDGSLIYGSLYGKTYREVREKKKDTLLRQHVKEEAMEPVSLTIEDITQRWLISIRHSVKESTFSCYVTLIQKHIIPYFSKDPHITSEQIQQFIDFKITNGLATATVRNIVILLERILKYAQAEHLLPTEVRNIRIPKNAFYTHDRLETYQLNILSRYLYLEQTAFTIGILLCMYTGIRIGELCGLRGEDFDFTNEIFVIHRTVSRIRNTVSLEQEPGQENSEKETAPKTKVVITSPKSPSSIREIPIPKQLISLLQQHLSKPDTYLLTETSKPAEPRCVQRRFQKILKQCGLPKVTFHSLRHSFATRCIEYGADSKAVSEILGHSSVKITLDIYVHSNMEQKRAYINQLII